MLTWGCFASIPQVNASGQKGREAEGMTSITGSGAEEFNTYNPYLEPLGLRGSERITPKQSRNPMIRHLKRSLNAPLRASKWKPIILGLSLGGLTAVAQDASPTGNTSDQNTIVLSPFEVTSNSDVGYSASETLAGNRLRTDIRDVGSSISVYTGKFLEDTGAVRAEDLLVYTTSGEVGGVRGNYSAAQNKGGFFDDTGAGSYVSPTANTRLRGLAVADVTRGFFITDIQFDAYNTDRVDIQRGANSILFGLAKPGGVINASLKQAEFTNHDSVQVKFDQYGTFRESGDFNQVLIPKQLALRVDLLDDSSKFEQAQAFRHDKRVYLTGRYEPAFLNKNDITTRIHVSYEGGTIRGADPVSLPPRDQFSTWWTLANKLRNVPAGAFNSVTGQWQGYTNPALGYNDAGSYQIDQAGNVLPSASLLLGNPGRFQENLAAVYLQPNSSLQGGPNMPAWMQHQAVANLAGEPNKAYSIFEGMRGLGATLGDIHAQPGFWKDPTISDPSIFDFYHNTLAGPNRENDQNFQALNLSFSQTYLDNQVGIELVYDYQRVSAKQDNAFTWQDGNSINVDINTTLADGSPNPNFGRPFVASDYVDNYLDFQKRRSTRATAFYDLDFKRYIKNSTWADILGRHTFTGMWSSQSDDHKSLRYSRSTIAGDYMETINQVGNPWNWGQAAGIHYIGSSLANASSPQNAHMQGLTAWQVPTNGYTGLFYDPNTHAWVSNREIGVNNDPYSNTFGAGWNKQTVDSRALVWQGHMLDDVIVPTIGWRSDTAKSYQANNAPINTATGFAIITDPSRWNLKDEPSSEFSGHSTSYSLVVHTPKSIKDKLPWGMEVDLTYNKSQNFNPSAGSEDVYGRPKQPQTGTTKDYGVTLSFFEQRLQFRAIRFDAAAQNAESGDLNTFWVVQSEVNYWNAAHDPYNVANHPDAVAAYLAHQVPDSLKQTWNWTETTNSAGITTAVASRTAGYTADTTDTVSKGYEFEIHAVPIRGWDVMFNASKTEAQQANNLGDLSAYMADRLPVWTGIAGEMVSSSSATTNLLQDTNANLIIPYQTGLARNGMAVQELHKWRWNLVSNYSFKEGALKGFSVGGAVRWQDKVAIGYGVKTAAAGNLIYDLDHPYLGDSITNYDMWLGYEHKLTAKINWKIQLNARDLFQKNKLVDVAAQPDGSIATYRIAPETTYTLTNTFSF